MGKKCIRKNTSCNQVLGSVIEELSNKGIKLNITAVYTFEQTKKSSKNLIKKPIL